MDFNEKLTLQHASMPSNQTGNKCFRLHFVGFSINVADLFVCAGPSRDTRIRYQNRNGIV